MGVILLRGLGGVDSRNGHGLGRGGVFWGLRSRLDGVDLMVFLGCQISSGFDGRGLGWSGVDRGGWIQGVVFLLGLRDRDFME